MKNSKIHILTEKIIINKGKTVIENQKFQIFWTSEETFKSLKKGKTYKKQEKKKETESHST